MTKKFIDSLSNRLFEFIEPPGGTERRTAVCLYIAPLQFIENHSSLVQQQEMNGFFIDIGGTA